MGRYENHVRDLEQKIRPKDVVDADGNNLASSRTDASRGSRTGGAHNLAFVPTENTAHGMESLVRLTTSGDRLSKAQTALSRLNDLANDGDGDERPSIDIELSRSGSHGSTG